jgi:endonuclease/exonuclease/phosphatase family metal-dependent hydrolase
MLHRDGFRTISPWFSKWIALWKRSILDGNTVRIVEKHYSHWQESRQAHLEAVLKEV